MDGDVRARAIEAARQYLRRLGWTELRVADDGANYTIYGCDGPEAVAVMVTVSERPAEAPPSAVNIKASIECVRLDHIDILLIGENRALLRHQRCLRTGSPASDAYEGTPQGRSPRPEGTAD